MLHVLQQVKGNPTTRSLLNYKTSPFQPFLDGLIRVGDWAKMTDECEHNKYPDVNLNLSSALHDWIPATISQSKTPSRPSGGLIPRFGQHFAFCHRSCTAHHTWYIFPYKPPKRQQCAPLCRMWIEAQWVTGQFTWGDTGSHTTAGNWTLMSKSLTHSPNTRPFSTPNLCSKTRAVQQETAESRDTKMFKATLTVTISNPVQITPTYSLDVS